MKAFLHVLVWALVAREIHCARRVDAKQQLERALEARGGSSHRAKREARRLSVRELMESGPETNVQVEESSTTVQGTKLWKMQEIYKGREVFDGQLTIETDADGIEVLDASGTFIQVQYRIEDEGEPRRPTAIVDGRTGVVVMKWDSMTKACAATGFGGNEKLGIIHYNGVDQECLDVTVEGDVCYLENDDVRVVHMRQLKWYNITDTWSYDCKNATDAVNGAFSPALDAFHIGTAVSKMFREWYGMRAVKGPKMVMRVHFGDSYPNAYWNGVNLTFGDGRALYPFVVVDLVGHEVGHAVIEQFSKLIWYREPGGVNEAFADITGEVVEYYMKGQVDWLVGADMVRGEEGEAVRYFIEPSDNFFSISHMSSLDEYLEPHETGGILAHAFYRIVALHGQEMRQAYHVFLHANQMYWHHMSSITSASCEIMKSAYDLGQPGEVYKQAFEHVGIEVCEISHHVMGLRNNDTYQGIRVSNTTRPIFTFSTPEQWVQTIIVTASSNHGDVYITLTNVTWMHAFQPNETCILAEGFGRVEFSVPDATKSNVTITLSSLSSDLWEDVSLVAGYKCVPPGLASHRRFEYMRRENCEGRAY